MGRLPYLPGLDGLRAIAVGVVVLYHAGLLWAPGGFLGVEIFFVISGYLITSLLVAEWRRDRRIALRHFWGRRARRLLPALFLLLIGTRPLPRYSPPTRSPACAPKPPPLWPMSRTGR